MNDLLVVVWKNVEIRRVPKSWYCGKLGIVRECKWYWQSPSAIYPAETIQEAKQQIDMCLPDLIAAMSNTARVDA